MSPLTYVHAGQGDGFASLDPTELMLDFDFADVLVDDPSDLLTEPFRHDALESDLQTAVDDFAFDADFDNSQAEEYPDSWHDHDLSILSQFAETDDLAGLHLNDLLNSDAIADLNAAGQVNPLSEENAANNYSTDLNDSTLPQSNETRHKPQFEDDAHTFSSSAPRIIPSAHTSGNTRKRKRSRVRFSAETLRPLQEWLDEHESDPYPSIEVKRQLSSQTGLSIKQISTWFTNSRRRQMSPDEPDEGTAKVAQCQDDETVDTELNSPVFKLPHIPISNQASDSPANGHVLPLSPRLGNTWPDTHDRFKCLDFPPCKRGFETQEALTRHIQDHLLGEKDNTEVVSDSLLDYGSLRSLQSLKSVSSVGSAFSQCSEAVMSGPPRRGRRRRPTRRESTALSQTPKSVRSTSDAVVYYCTFCGKEMHAKTWKRHEETQHLPRHQWTCMLDGYRTRIADAGAEACVFCGEEEPASTHGAECHRIAACLETPDKDRTFQRKDHLAQHLKNFHSFPNLSDDLASVWHTESDYSQQRWRCGFCDLTLRTWNERARHIAKHFRQGATMVDWDSSKDDLILSIDASTTSVATTDMQPSTSVDRETNGSLAATLQRTTLMASGSTSIGKSTIDSLSTRKLRIGSWQRTARAATDLKVFYDASKSTLYYCTMDDSVGYRIEIPFSAIQTLSLHTSSEHTSTRAGIRSEFEGVALKLNRTPTFTRSFPELGPFEPCDDFTDDQQASTSLTHYLHGNSNILAGQLAKLMALNGFQKRHQNSR